MSGLTDENMLERVGRITASAFASIMLGGGDRLRVIMRIARERTKGEVQNFNPSEAMRYGTNNEKYALAEFKKKFPKAEENNAFYAEDFKSEKDGIVILVGATPDALQEDGEPIEIKSPFSDGNFDVQVQVADRIMMTEDRAGGIFSDEYQSVYFGKQIQGYFWQLAFQVWVMRLMRRKSGMEDWDELRHGTLVLSPPGNVGQRVFRPRFDDKIFAEIEAVIVRAERDIREECGNKIEAVGEGGKETVASVVESISQMKGKLNVVDDLMKKVRKEIDRRKAVVVSEVAPDIEAKMSWLKDNMDESHLSGDTRIAGLSVKESRTIEIQDWEKVPKSMLKVSLDKTAAAKYFDENGELPAGTEWRKGEPTITVRAKSKAATLEAAEMETLTGPLIGLEE